MQTLRLSEAIRLGAMMVPAEHGVLVTYAGPDYVHPIGACAIGTALVAVGWPKIGCAAQTVFPLLTREVLPPSRGWWLNWLDGRRPQTVYHIVILLFELRKWSRGRIADWVETVESEVEPQTYGDVGKRSSRLTVYEKTEGSSPSVLAR